MYGSDRVLLESVRALIEDGRPVLVALPGPGPLVSALRERGAEVTFCISPVVRKSVFRPAGFGRFIVDAIRGVWSGWALLRRAQPDVVFVNTLTVPLWLLLGRLVGVPVLCHVHEAEGSAPRLTRKVLTAPLLLANAVITNSDFSREVLATGFKALGRRTTVVYNGVPGPPSVVEPRLALDGVVRLLYVGRLSGRKGVDLAVEATGLLRDRGIFASLDIVGSVFPGYEWFETELRDSVARLGLTDVVVFRGFLDSVWPRLAAADIAIVPSRLDEPFGNTAVEASLAGRPLVVSDTSGLREATAHAEATVAVAPGDAGALADAVEVIVADWLYYRRLAATDAEMYADLYSVHRYGREINAAVAATEQSGVNA